MYSKGISSEGDILDQATNFNIVKKSGTWFSYGETRLGQGRENVKRFLLENPEMLREIELQVREKLGLITPAAEPAKKA
jgi:recombination protein RecA